MITKTSLVRTSFWFASSLLLLAAPTSLVLAQTGIEPGESVPAGPRPTATVTPLQTTPEPTATVTPLPSSSPSGTQPQTTNTIPPSPTPTPSPTETPQTTNTVAPSPSPTL